MPEGHVGLLYLEGDGRLLFHHEDTGEETVVEVKPGRFVSWNNAMYTHTLVPGNTPRRLLGPMAFRDGGLLSVGNGWDGPENVLTQLRVRSLHVRAGGVAHVFLDMTALENEADELTVTVGGEKTERKGRAGLEKQRLSYRSSNTYFFIALSCRFSRCISPTSTCLP